MDNKTGSNHGRKVVRKCKKKHGKHWEKCQNTNSVFGTIWPSVDPKMVQNWSFSPTHCFYVFPGICRRFWPEVLTQTPKNAVFRPRSYSKGPNHALEKVLTKETPCMEQMANSRASIVGVGRPVESNLCLKTHALRVVMHLGARPCLCGKGNPLSTPPCATTLRQLFVDHDR